MTSFGALRMAVETGRSGARGEPSADVCQP